jgi:serine O-acetyltransferase
MSGLRAAIAADIARYRRAHPPSRRADLSALWQQQGLQATIVYRFGRALKRRQRQFWLSPLLLPGWLLYWLTAWFIRAGYGIRLSLSADIGTGCYIGHFGGIEVGHCVLGPGCSVGEQATVGSATQLGGPTIGARVWIGGHARISGAVSVGDDATIGSGALITSDVPPRALMMGRPARMICGDYDNTRIL